MGRVCLVHIIRAQTCNAPFVLSIIPKGAIRTRVEQASVTWATYNKLTPLITPTLTSSVLDAKEGSSGEGNGLSPGTSSEPLMPLGLFNAATMQGQCCHSDVSVLHFFSIYLRSPVVSPLLQQLNEQLWSIARRSLRTYLSLWTIIASWTNTRLKQYVNDCVGIYYYYYYNPKCIINC